MDSSFVHPLQAVQVRSVLSYTILLSDFLWNKELLTTMDRNKPIPAVNAMYKYLIEPNADSPAPINHSRLNKLTKYLIRNSDLYGSEEGEILDSHFIQSLFNHIINSLVFNKYGNVYGFIAEVVRSSSFTTEDEIRKSLLEKLQYETFKNKDGSLSKLDGHAYVKIFQQYILPLFPKTKNNTSIFSIDYIYAQAGSMFFRSLSNASVDTTTPEEFKVLLFDENKHFNEYIRVAHVVEQLISTRKIDYSVLRIFAFPALLYYVRIKQDSLRSKSITNIINNQTEWQTAFKYLFSNLRDFFELVDEVQDKNYNKYRFLHAMKTYENQSSLARSHLKSNCPNMSNDVIEKKVDEYLKCTKDCFCLDQGKRKNLTLVTSLFGEQFNSTVEKYATYERAALKSIFPAAIKELMCNQKVQVWKGLFENSYVADLGPGMKNAVSVQAVPEQHDILEFNFPGTKHSAYYGLIRKDFEVSLINETFDDHFKEKLEIYSFVPAPWKFTISLKKASENFDDFLTKITRERVNIFRENLMYYKNKKEKQPWWKKILLSAIPFYSCVEAIKEKNVDFAEMACLIDITVFLPGAIEVSMALKELTAVTSETLTKISLTSIKAATSRLSLRAAIRPGGRILMEEGMKFMESFTPQLFQKVGIAVFRMVDPGFELLYALGEGGFKSIEYLVAMVETKYPGSFSLIQETLKNARDGMTTVTKELAEKLSFDALKNEKVLCNSLEKNSGYGYKFINTLEGKILSVRTVEEFPYKVPVSFSRSGIYPETYAHTYAPSTKVVDELNVIQFYETKSENVHLVHGSELKLTEREFTVRFKNVPLSCSGHRLKRSPVEVCSRANLLKKRNARIEEAVSFATMNPLTKRKIRKELGKYLFLEESEKGELDFVKEWKENGFLNVPEWSETYKIELPEVYDELRYNEELSKRRDPKSSEDAIMYSVFKARGLKIHVSFEDYKNIHYYTEDYFKVTAVHRDVQESLYRLAIRQSDDDIMEYDKKLYLVETKRSRYIDKLFSIGKEYEFDKFTSTTTNDYFAPSYALAYQDRYQTKVQYEMYFPDTYLRAKLEIFTGDINREETILLPGSKFEITGVRKETLLGGDKTVTVKMTYKHKSKLEDIKSVMEQLKKLRDSGA